MICVSSLMMRLIDKTFYLGVGKLLATSLGQYQHGFRSSHSCQTAYKEVLDWGFVGEKGSYHGLLVDVRKAFDSVDRQQALDVARSRIRQLAALSESEQESFSKLLTFIL